MHQLTRFGRIDTTKLFDASQGIIDKMGTNLAHHGRDAAFRKLGIECIYVDQDASDEEIVEAAMSCIPTDSWLYDNMKHMLELVELAETDFCKAWMALHDDFCTRYKASVEEAIPQAFALFLLSKGSFERGIILAANFGRDADTVGAVLGAIRGAQLGASKIPEAWIERTGYPSGTCLQFTKGLTIRGLAKDLAALIK